MTRHTLLCTVGTSLFESNLSRLSEDTPDKPPNWREIRQAYDGKQWNRLAAELLQVDPSKRICGAEINTIEEASKKEWLELESISFLVSDTPHGDNTGKVLQAYFTQRKDLNLRAVNYCVVEDLQDERPKDFKVHGLRNLVRRAGEIIQRAGGPENVAIDATGGYKAQIAIAVLLGQALNIPVSYKHERFSEIIDFPPLPISFDYQILARNADLLTDFERGETLSSSEIDPLDDTLRVLLTEVSVNGESLYELSPIGQIYLTGFRIRNPRPVNLIEAETRKPPTFGKKGHHFPDGFKEFVHKVCDENNWIREAHSIHYAGQSAIKGKGFFVRQENETLQLIGTFRTNFGARFRLHITDQSTDALAWAADFLNQKYR